MTDDSTLGGYLDLHDRPPAFTGSDGAPYSAAVYVDNDPDQEGSYEGAVLFVRWSESGDRPVGHVETPVLVRAPTKAEVEAGLRALTLYRLKSELDRAIAVREELDAW